jgi:hypothetical protein
MQERKGTTMTRYRLIAITAIRGSKLTERHEISDNDSRHAAFWGAIDILRNGLRMNGRKYRVMGVEVGPVRRAKGKGK